MYTKRYQSFKLLLCLVDCLLLVGCFILAGLMRYHSYSLFSFITDIPVISLVLLFVGVATFFLLDLSTGFRNRGYLIELGKVLSFNLIIFIALTAYAFTTKNEATLSRLTLLYLLAINTAIQYLSHIIIKAVAVRFFSIENVQKLLIITDTRCQGDLEKRLKDQQSSMRHAVGIIVLDAPKERIGNYIEQIPIVGNGQTYLQYAAAHVVDEVVILVSNETQHSEDLRDLIQQLELMGVVVQLKISIIDIGQRNTQRVYRFDDFYVASYVSRLFDFRELIIKRIMDICISLIGLVCTLIISLLIIIPLKLESPGPLFFGQMRVGKNGRNFKMYKFRSMCKDAEALKASLMDQNEMKGHLFKMTNDPRITKIGRFLRRYSLDEFPQFWNVLKGDMSIVGTRPPTADEFASYNHVQKSRLSFFPGMTGLWQVSGRNNISDFNDILELDLQYIREWSIYLDIKIILRTFLVFVIPRGAK